MSSPTGLTKMVSMVMPMATVTAMEVSMVTRFGLNDFCTG
jgi:putative flippase GtrA